MDLFEEEAKKTPDYQEWIRLRPVWKMSSSWVWIGVIAVFAIVDLFVIVAAVLELLQIWDPF
jgi:hypothetical protein